MAATYIRDKRKMSTPNNAPRPQKSDLIQFTPSSMEGTPSNAVPFTPANTPATHLPYGNQGASTAGLLESAQKQRQLAEHAAIKLIQLSGAIAGSKETKIQRNENGAPLTTPFSHLRVSPGHFLVLPSAVQQAAMAAQQSPLPEPSPVVSQHGDQLSVSLVDNLNQALRALGHTPSRLDRTTGTPSRMGPAGGSGEPPHTPYSGTSSSPSSVSACASVSFGSATKRLTDLQHRHSRVLSDVDTAGKALKQAEAKRDQAASELESVKCQVHEADAQLRTLQLQINDLTSATDNKQVMKVTLDTELESLRALIQATVSEKESSRKEARRAAQELHQVYGRLAGAKLELSRMEEKLNLEQDQLKQLLQVEFEAVKQQVEERIAAAKTELADLIEQQHQAQAGADLAQASQREAAAALQLLIKQREREESEAEQAQQEAQAVLHGMLAEQQSAQELAAEAKLILEEKMTAAQATQQEVTTSEKRLKVLLAAIEAATVRLSKLQADETAASEALQRHHSAQTEADAACRAAEMQLTCLSAQVMEVERLRVAEEGKVRAARKELECVNTAHAAADASLKVTLEQAAAAAQEAAFADARNAENEAETIKKQFETIQRLEAELHTTRQQVTNLTLRAETAEDAAAKALEGQQHLEWELSAAQKLLERQGSQLFDVEAKVAAAEAALARECEDRWAAESELIQAGEDAEQAQQELQRVREQQAQSMDLQLAAAEIKAAEMRGAAAAESNRAESAEERAQHAEQRAAIAEDQMCQALEERDAASDRAQALQEQVTALTSEMETLTSALTQHKHLASQTIDQVQELQSGLAKLKLERNGAQEMCGLLEEQLDKVQRRLKGEVTRAAQAEAEIETGGLGQHKEIEELQKQLKDMKAKNSTLKATAARLARALVSFMKHANTGGTTLPWEQEFDGARELLDNLTAVEVLLRQD